MMKVIGDAPRRITLSLLLYFTFCCTLQLGDAFVSHKRLLENGIKEFTVGKEIKGNECICNCLCASVSSAARVGGAFSEGPFTLPLPTTPDIKQLQGSFGQLVDSARIKYFKIVKEIKKNKCSCSCACSPATGLIIDAAMPRSAPTPTSTTTTTTTVTQSMSGTQPPPVSKTASETASTATTSVRTRTSTSRLEPLITSTPTSAKQLTTTRIAELSDSNATHIPNASLKTESSTPFDGPTPSLSTALPTTTVDPLYKVKVANLLNMLKEQLLSIRVQKLHPATTAAPNSFTHLSEEAPGPATATTELLTTTPAISLSVAQRAEILLTNLRMKLEGLKRQQAAYTATSSTTSTPSSTTVNISAFGVSSTRETASDTPLTLLSPSAGSPTASSTSTVSSTITSTLPTTTPSSSTTTSTPPSTVTSTAPRATTPSPTTKTTTTTPTTTTPSTVPTTAAARPTTTTATPATVPSTTTISSTTTNSNAPPTTSTVPTTISSSRSLATTTLPIITTPRNNNPASSTDSSKSQRLPVVTTHPITNHTEPTSTTTGGQQFSTSTTKISTRLPDSNATAAIEASGNISSAAKFPIADGNMVDRMLEGFRMGKVKEVGEQADEQASREVGASREGSREEGRSRSSSSSASASEEEARHATNSAEEESKEFERNNERGDERGGKVVGAGRQGPRGHLSTAVPGTGRRGANRLNTPAAKSREQSGEELSLGAVGSFVTATPDTSASTNSDASVYTTTVVDDDSPLVRVDPRRQRRPNVATKRLEVKQSVEDSEETTAEEETRTRAPVARHHSPTPRTPPSQFLTDEETTPLIREVKVTGRPVQIMLTRPGAVISATEVATLSSNANGHVLEEVGGDCKQRVIIAVLKIQARQLREEKRHLEAENSVLKKASAGDDITATQAIAERKKEIERKLARLAQMERLQREILERRQLQHNTDAHTDVTTTTSTQTVIDGDHRGSVIRSEECELVKRFALTLHMDDSRTWVEENCEKVKSHFPAASCSYIREAFDRCFR